MARPLMEAIVRQPLLAARLAVKTQERVERALGRGSARIERGAKRGVATNYGILRGAILAIKDKASLAWTIGTRDLSHAKFVEFGTGPAGAASPKVSALAREAMMSIGYKHGSGNFRPPIRAIQLWAKRKGIPEELVFPIARAIGRKGIKAQPFLFPAYEKERPGIIAEISRAVRSVFGLK